MHPDATVVHRVTESPASHKKVVTKEEFDKSTLPPLPFQPTDKKSMDPGSRSHQQLNKPIPTSPPPESKRDDDDYDMKRKSSSQDDSDEEENGKLSGSGDQQQQQPQLPSHPFNQGRGGTPSTGQGGGQYPMQPSLQQQQEALFQQEVLYQAQQAAQQQQGRGGSATPQYPPAPGDSSLLFGGSAAASSFSAELLRQLANTPGGLSSAMAAAGMGQQQQQRTPGGERGGAFSAFGQTPLTTAASFGSSSGAPTPQQQQQQQQGGNIRGSAATSHLGAIHGGGSSSGMDRLVDNLGGIQPTPISLRGRGNPQLSTLQSQLATQQAMQQQLQLLQQQEIQREQQRQQQQQQSQGRGGGGGSSSMLPSVNEDDPLMQYETRPGSLADQSPMAPSAGVKRRSSTSSVQGSTADDGRDSSGRGSGSNTPLDRPQDQRQLVATSAAAQQDTTSEGGGTLSEFPFLFDGYAAWVCRHCQHVPPYYRGGNYVWQASQPPPNHFVDMHLRFCPGLNPGNMPPPANLPPSQAAGMSRDLIPYPIQQPRQQSQLLNPFDIQETSRGQDPPGTSPTLHQPRAPSGGGSQYHDSSQYPYHPYLMEGGGAELRPSPSPVEGKKGEKTPGGKKRKKPGTSKASPKGRPTDDVTYRAAIEFLTKKTRDMARPEIPGTDIGQGLIERSDADLLTDYFYHMMQQLVVCRFSEKDRKTRGGKRENINIGYGGLQCIHCIEAPQARKFFWSTVDRLANSFAEIPSHVLKCKHCPDNMKDALLALKGRHSDQMQMLPRGSQKVFFRRMWRRLHDGDTELTPVKDQVSRGREPPPPTTEARAKAAAAAIAAEAALKSPKINAPAAASLLAKSAKKLESQAKEGDGSPEQTVPLDQRVLLAIPEDKDWLSDMDCFVRNNIEVFSSKQIDMDNAAADRKYPIKIGQVGIRCVHCAMAEGGARGAAVSYPYSISGIYEAVREFQRLHLENCENLPKDLKATASKLGTGSSSLSSVLRRYYVQAARALGLFDTQDNGIRAGGKPMALSTAGFQPASTIRSRSSTTSPPMQRDAPGTAPERGASIRASSTSVKSSLKRKSSATAGDEEEKAATPKSKRKKISRDPSGLSEDTPQQDAPAGNELPSQQDAPGKMADELSFPPSPINSPEDPGNPKSDWIPKAA